jgi:hypothetical protein
MPSLTKPFLLPGIIPTDVLGRPQVKNVQNRRTVHVYVPPPLLHGNSKSNDRKGLQQNSDVPKANGSRNLTHTSFISLNSDAEIKSITDADVYPSPSRSRVSRPSSLVRGRTDVRLTPKSHPNPMYHPLSPPTSDLPIPGEDADIQFRLDPRDVRRKHPATKALFDKVFSNISFHSFTLIYSGPNFLAYTRFLCLPPGHPGPRELWRCLQGC